MRGFRKVIF